MMWIRLAIAIIVLGTSCLGLGYLAGFWLRRRKWPEWVGRLLTLAMALLWPAIVVGYTVYDARRYQAQHPYDDAPGMVVGSVISVIAPLLFFISLAFAFIGLSIEQRRDSEGNYSSD